MHIIKVTDYNYYSGARSVLLNLDRIAFIEADGKLREPRAGAGKNLLLHVVFFTSDFIVTVDEADYRRITAAMGIR